MSTVSRLTLLAALTMLAACTVKDSAPPPMTGPSELALRLALQAIPDSILQDGASQAALHIEAASYDGRPVRGLTLRIQTIFQGQRQDFGTLSTKTVVTGEDGRARAVYTAPPRPAEPVDEANVVTFEVTPIGNDYRGEISRSVDLRLVTPGVIQPPRPPNPAPTAVFAFSPSSPTPLQSVAFDASQSTDVSADGATVPCLNCTFAWNFGDGATANGMFVTHAFQRVGNYQVRLTVTDADGASHTAAQAITVGAGALPTPAFTFSPPQPATSQDIFFNASGSRAAEGRQIVAYEWDFGSGRTGEGVTITKRYDTPGTYVVTLKVTDNTGQFATTSQNVTVGGTGTGPQPALTVSPTAGTTATTFFFDASATRGPSPIVEYRFTFGDNTPDVVGSSPTTSHQFALPGTYVVRLTVRDSANRTATTTISLTVAP